MRPLITNKSEKVKEIIICKANIIPNREIMSQCQGY